jgi:hypothetical protein
MEITHQAIKELLQLGSYPIGSHLLNFSFFLSFKIVVLYLGEGSKTRPFSYKESQGTFHVWKVLRLEEDAFVPCHDKLN